MKNPIKILERRNATYVAATKKVCDIIEPSLRAVAKVASLEYDQIQWLDVIQEGEEVTVFYSYDTELLGGEPGQYTTSIATIPNEILLLNDEDETYGYFVVQIGEVYESEETVINEIFVPTKETLH